MIPLLLTAISLGQCAGGSCYAPSSSYLPTFAAAVIYLQPATFTQAPAPAPTIRRYRTVYQGMDLVVEGWLDANGQINWQADRAFNAEAIRAARARAIEAREESARTEAAKASFLKAEAARVKALEAEAEARRRIKPAGFQNYGLDFEKIFPPGSPPEKYHATTPEGRAFIELAKAGVDKLPDDSGKPFVTVIGQGSNTESAFTALASLRSETRLGKFAADAWQVKGIGLAAKGDPSIVVQDPSGRVIYREDGFDGDGKALLARVSGKLRRPNPDYDPAKDPGPNAMAAAGSDMIAFAVIGACVLLFLSGRKAGS